MSFMETWRWEFKSKLQQTGALLKCLSTLPPSPNRDLSTSLWRKVRPGVSSGVCSRHGGREEGREGERWRESESEREMEKRLRVGELERARAMESVGESERARPVYTQTDILCIST